MSTGRHRSAIFVALLILSCSKSPTTPSPLGMAGGGMVQVAGAATGGAGAGTAAEGTNGGAASSGRGGVPNDYDDSGCEHLTVAADCSDGWCKVPPGCFIVGSPEHEWGRPQESG